MNIAKVNFTNTGLSCSRKKSENNYAAITPQVSFGNNNIAAKTHISLQKILSSVWQSIIKGFSEYAKSNAKVF